MSKTTDAASTGGSTHDHEADYAAFLQGVRTRFAEVTIGQRAVFTTDAASANAWSDYHIDRWN